MNTLQAFNSEKKFKLILIRNPELKCFFDCEKNKINIDKTYEMESILCKNESIFLRFLVDISMGIKNSIAYQAIILSDNFDQELQSEAVNYGKNPYLLNYSPDKKIKLIESVYMRFLYSK